MTRGSETNRSILVSLGANVAIAVVKLVGALVTGSGSMLAEALHSIADSGNEGLLLWGRRRATLAWLVPLALTGLCTLAVSRYLHSELLTAALLGGGVAAALATGLAFVRAPGPRLARRIEHVSSAWTFVVYLCLGLLPILI